MLEPHAPYEFLRRYRDLLVLTILGVVALLFSGLHTTTAFSKTTTLYVLVWLTLIVEFVLVCREGWSGIRIWRATLICLGAYLAWCVISAVWIAPIPRSFRELSRILALMTLVVVSIGAGRSDWFRHQVLWFGTVIPLIVAVYACVQSLGYDFFMWGDFDWGGDFKRVTSTLGNPDFMAGYLLATIPLSVAFGLASEKRWSKILAGISAGLQVIAIVLSLSRGVWVGVAWSLIALAAILPNWREYFRRAGEIARQPRILQAGSVGLVILVIVLWPALAGLCQRFAGGVGSSLEERGLIYVSSMKLLKESPLCGVGLDAFPVRFPEVRDPRLSRYLPIGGLSIGGFYVEHAHSEFLEVLVNVGLVGFLLWMGSLFFWSKTLLQRLHSSDRTAALLAGACWISVAGTLGHNLFTVTLRHTSSAAMFWSMFGIAMGALGQSEEPQNIRREKNWRWVVLALLIAGGPLVWWHGVREHPCDRYLRQASDVIDYALVEKSPSRKTEICYRVLDLLAKADRLSPPHKESLYWRAWAYYELGEYLAAKSEYLRILNLEGPFMETIPNIGKCHIREGANYMLLGFLEPAMKMYRDSIPWWEKACQMDPERAEHWRNYGGMLGTLGRIEESRAAYSRALELEPTPEGKEEIRNLLEKLTKSEGILKESADWFLTIEEQNGRSTKENSE